ncbi:TIM21-domain-containing protein [Cryomyces antarcticus]
MLPSTARTHLQPKQTSPRNYATTNSLPRNPSSTTSHRKAITVASDDGRVRWTELSTGEKVARSTQQSFNFLVVIAGVLMTGAVATVLYLEVFSMDSKTAIFNRAADKVKKDARCVEVLGPKKEIIAFGEPSWSRWARNRTIASRTEKDKAGIDHLYMHFNVQGPLNAGVVNLHMTKRPDESEFEYRFLSLDVKGHERIYIENADAGKLDKRNQGKMFGVRWW